MHAVEVASFAEQRAADARSTIGRADLPHDHRRTVPHPVDGTVAALTGLRKRGYAVVIDRSERGSFYRIVADLTVGDRASVARPVEERANPAAARKPAQLSRSRARRAA